ncbi:hypothetical protein ACIPIN_06385 [Pseudomonas sp. NPDC087697]|uniref:hypothetical protein n=1 Tax=Pseudomonas sp. NPDC087697 TaxID=3364447 RepID=UPI0037FE397E
MSKRTWWEKTVEYKFVVDAMLKERCDFAAPLAGKHERAGGDTIFGLGTRLILVEFKRDLSEVPSEKELFDDYAEATEKLSKYDHHFIVYGEFMFGPPENLQLVAQHYFSEPNVNYSALDILDFGVTEANFNKYLAILAKRKKPDGRGKGKKHVTSLAMSAVIGVSTDGKMIGSVSLHDYSPKLFPSLVLPPPSQQLSSPEFGARS